MNTCLLIIDDDPISLGAINQMLKGRYKLAFCSDSTQAPELIERLSPSLIITDNSMPGMTGLEVIAWVRNNPQTQSLPIILYTGACESVDPPGDREVTVMIDKNTEETVLIDTIEALLKRADQAG